MDKCIFCKVVKGEIPSYTLYQDDIATAFLDINPVTIGHILVIPNKHFRRIDSIKDENVMKGLMNAIIEMANLLIKSGITFSSLIESNRMSRLLNSSHVA